MQRRSGTDVCTGTANPKEAKYFKVKNRVKGKERDTKRKSSCCETGREAGCSFMMIREERDLKRVIYP